MSLQFRDSELRKTCQNCFIALTSTSALFYILPFLMISLNMANSTIKNEEC